MRVGDMCLDLQRVFEMDKLIPREVILGVDTHLDTHVGVVIDCRGKMLDVLSYRNQPNWIS